jgi:hypothetical protein
MSESGIRTPSSMKSRSSLRGRSRAMETRRLLPFYGSGELRRVVGVGAPASGPVSKFGGRQVSRCQVRGRLRAEGYPEPAYDEVIRVGSVRRSSSGGLLIGLVPAFLESFLPG